jgi:hypothetical protein
VVEAGVGAEEGPAGVDAMESSSIFSDNLGGDIAQELTLERRHGVEINDVGVFADIRVDELSMDDSEV